MSLCVSGCEEKHKLELPDHSLFRLVLPLWGHTAAVPNSLFLSVGTRVNSVFSLFVAVAEPLESVPVLFHPL